MHDEKILPVEEMVEYEEFTDRVEILRELDMWVKNIQRMASPSTAILAPRRMGKTVLLDRLVNTVFFKPEYRVAPFYFRMKQEEKTLRDFLLEYATTFFRQYIAYCHQDPVLYSSRTRLEQLLKYQSDHKAVDLAKANIEDFLYNYDNYDDIINQWDGFVTVPERLASYSGIRVAVIIDEFQDMKFYVHDVDKSELERLRKKRLKNPYALGTNLTASYGRQAQSKKAPMLVCGSSVTLIFRTVMGGPLGGRFGFTYLKPFSVPDGAALLHSLLDIYTPANYDRPISSKNALYASAQTGGHPYYLYCLVMSKCDSKKFDDKASIDRIIKYEIEQGKIYGFWQTHFHDNRRIINADEDDALGKKIIYYFTMYNNRPVEIKEIAEKLQVTKKAVEAKIEKLYQADLVYRNAARFYTFNDICLMRYIKFVYEKDITGIDDIDLSQQNLFNTLKGKFLEIVVQVTMMKFNCEILAGKFFGKTGSIEMPLFQFIDSRYVKGAKTRSFQIDVYGSELMKERVWLCECKYTRAKMGIRQVEKLESAAEALKQECEETERAIPEIQMWIVSTGGFTEEVIEYVKSREDIYCSDHEGINSIFREYGGNYKIPIFTKEGENS
ncbi:hypothetical protein QUF76_02675 [Desulfobacterales bacterium HSG16]|nr:hypothetical protein [Desulfobacterales bacterium HSG16]